MPRNVSKHVLEEIMNNSKVMEAIILKGRFLSCSNPIQILENWGLSPLNLEWVGAAVCGIPVYPSDLHF